MRTLHLPFCIGRSSAVRSRAMASGHSYKRDTYRQHLADADMPAIAWVATSRDTYATLKSPLESFRLRTCKWFELLGGGS